MACRSRSKCSKSTVGVRASFGLKKSKREGKSYNKFVTLTDDLTRITSKLIEAKRAAASGGSSDDNTMAAVLGFLTAGPIGSIAGWGVIRAVQGRWMTWVTIAEELLSELHYKPLKHVTYCVRRVSQLLILL